MGKTDSTWRISLIYCQSNQSRIMRSKNKSYKHFPSTPPFFPGSTSLLIFSLPPKRSRGTGSGGCSQFIPCCLYCSFLLTLFASSSVDSLPQERVLHKLLQREPFPQPTVLPKLPQGGAFPQGAVLQEWTALVCVPHEVTSPARKPAPAWAPLSACGHRSCQDPAPARALHMVTASFRDPPALVWAPPWAAGGGLLYHGPAWAAEGQPASPWSASRASGENSLL